MLLLLLVFAIECLSGVLASCIIGIDCGTESARVGLFDCSGKLLSSGVTEYRSGTIFPRSGWAEQIPSDWWEAVGIACHQCLADAKIDHSTIKGVCLDATCCSVVALDSNFVPLRPCLLWMDSRSAVQAKRIIDSAKGDSSLYVNNNGEGPISAEWMIPKSLWIKENEPEIWQKSKYICEKLDFLNFKMTGILCASGCNVAARWHWDAELACDVSEDKSNVFAGRPVTLLEKIGLKDLLHKWPSKCVEMGRLIGALKPEAKKHLGIVSSSPISVIQGGPDAYVGMVGLGCVKPGKIALITGSSHLHLTVVPKTGEKRGRRGVWGPYSGAPFVGRMFAEGGQSSTGSVLAWMKKLLNSAVVEEKDQLTYDSLNDQAAATPIGGDGLLSLATFQGARTPVTDSLLRGALVGLTLSHGKGHIWRALLEGVCYGTKAAVDALLSSCDGEHDKDQQSICMAGGATRSEFWLQMHADVTSSAVTVGQVDNAPLLGSAVLAAVGAGLFRIQGTASAFLDEVDSAVEAMVHEARRVNPIPANTAQYARFYSVYSHLASTLQRISHALALNETLPMLQTAQGSVRSDLKLKSNRPAVVMPSILAADFGHLAAEARDCESFGAQWLHVDVCDGGKKWCPGALTLGPQAVAAIHEACPSLHLDVHIVSDNIEELLKPLSIAGASRITFQLEQIVPSTSSSLEDTDHRRVEQLISKIRSLNMTAGLCIAPSTPLAYLMKILSRLPVDEDGNTIIEAIDILAVSPGFGGQKFDRSVLQKVEHIHRAFPSLKHLAVDGGVDRNTAGLAAQAGANVLIAGSSIFGSNRRRRSDDVSSLKHSFEEIQVILHTHGI